MLLAYTQTMSPEVERMGTVDIYYNFLNLPIFGNYLDYFPVLAFVENSAKKKKNLMCIPLHTVLYIFFPVFLQLY